MHGQSKDGRQTTLLPPYVTHTHDIFFFMHGGVPLGEHTIAAYFYFFFWVPIFFSKYRERLGSFMANLVLRRLL